MGSALPVPEVIVFHSNTHEIRGGLESSLFKGIGFRFNENLIFSQADYPCEGGTFQSGSSPTDGASAVLQALYTSSDVTFRHPFYR